MDISSLARHNISKMQAYSSGKSEFGGVADIYLDTNENPFGDGIVNRYPDPLQRKLLERIAVIKSAQFATDLSSDNLALGNGSDEIIDMLVRIFCSPGTDALVHTPPTFGMYQVVADLNDIEAVSVPLDADFDLDVDGILDHNGRANLLFLCSPNNPTGNSMSHDRLEKIITAWQGIVVLDEAYIDFCAEKSFVPRLAEYPHLAILQTFSKAWGMAGVRLGFCIAGEQIISLLRKVKMPYNIDALKARFVMERIREVSQFQVEVGQILAERKRMQSELTRFALRIFPTDANFLLVQFADGDRVYRHLLDHGVVVRNFSAHPRLPGCLRITIGTVEENDRVLKLLSELT